VLSTLHTNSAPETVVRLLDMGMDPFNFADSLVAVVAQQKMELLVLLAQELLVKATQGELVETEVVEALIQEQVAVVVQAQLEEVVQVQLLVVLAAMEPLHLFLVHL
jgi:Tfp pilus assembly pilus retraction ATPase PilT